MSTADNVKERWYKPVNRLGRITTWGAIVCSFFPALYLYAQYGQFPDGATVLVGCISIWSFCGVYYVMEPISYFSALGTAGSYMGILAGSIGQMRVPAALVAKATLETKDGTQEAEIVGTAGIAGSVFTNTLITTLTAVIGTWLLSVFPPVITKNMSGYVLPGIYGAVGAMLATNMKLFIPSFGIMMLINILYNQGIINFFPVWVITVLSVFIGLGWGRIAYAKLKILD